MITQVVLTDFRSHAATSVPLAPLTVIVGPNGVGKTSILRAVHLTTQMCRLPFQLAFSGHLAAKNVVRKGSEAFSIALSGSEPEWSMVLTAQALRQGRWETQVRSVLDSVETKRDAGYINPDEGVLGTSEELAKLVSSAVHLRLEPRRIRQIAPMQNYPRVEYDGSGVAAVLAEVALGEPELFQRVQEDLQRIVPSLVRLRVNQAVRPKPGGQSQLPFFENGQADGLPPTLSGFELSFDFVGASNIPAWSASEGTLIATALATLINVDGVRPRLILLDDLEASLHPKAQWELIDMLRRAIAVNPGLQVVATSHSPYLVDQLEYHEVVVCAIAPDGTTRCAPLSAHPQADRMKGVLSTGEFLSAEGEDWVLEASGG